MNSPHLCGISVLADSGAGGFITGSKDGILSQPGGMILQSIANGQPIMHVEINYRLNGEIPGVFSLLTIVKLIDQQSSASLRQML